MGCVDSKVVRSTEPLVMKAWVGGRECISCALYIFKQESCSVVHRVWARTQDCYGPRHHAESA